MEVPRPDLHLGLLSLATHPGHTADWQALVTLIGWLATAKVALLLLVPDMLMHLSQRLLPSPANLRFWGIGPIALGAFLAVTSFDPRRERRIAQYLMNR